MIRFSNRVKYGVQFMLFLCIDDDGFTGIQRAALSCDIPQKFLEAIAVDLKKKGLLEVKRGAGGGYRLAREKALIHLSDIVEALGLEGIKSDKMDGDLVSKVTEQILRKTVETFWETMRGVTLADIHRDYVERAESLMYYI